MLSNNLVLQSLGPALQEIQDQLTPISLRAGQVLNEPGQKVRRAYFLTGGLVSARALLASGRQMECSLVGRTSALGVVAAIGFHTSLTQDVCLFDSHAWTISLGDLQAGMRRAPAIEQQIRAFCYGQMAYAVGVGVCNAMHTAEQRLARWLLTARELLGDPEIRLPQEELANILGLQRSVVNPSLQRLKAEGLVSLGRGRLVIADEPGLRRRVCECHGRLEQALHLSSPADAADAARPFGRRSA